MGNQPGKGGPIDEDLLKSASDVAFLKDTMNILTPNFDATKLSVPVPPSGVAASTSTSSSSSAQATTQSNDSDDADEPQADSKTSDSATAPPPKSRRQFRRTASIKVGDVMQVRENIDQQSDDVGQKSRFTKAMDFWKQIELVGGTDPRKQQDDSTVSKRGSIAEEKTNANGDVEESVSLAPDADQDAIDAKNLKRIEKKKNIIKETQASEQLYFKFLSMMIKHFIQPLRDRQIIPNDMIENIFSNIEKIAPYHKALADELQRKPLPQVFHEYAQYLKVYAPYVNNYDSACDVVASLKKHKKFQEFLKEKRAEPECGGLDLMSFLIMPIQRIPRYRLLLESLMKYTRDDDQDKKLLGEALTQINTIANYVNETKRAAESRSKIVEIQNRLSGDFNNLLTPGRRLIHDSELQQKKTLSNTGVHLYLFNDLLLWCTQKWEFQGVITLATATVEEYQHKTKHGFIVKAVAFKDDLTFLCTSALEKKLWIKKINHALAAARATMLGARQRSLSRRSFRFGNAPLIKPPSD